VVPPENGAGWLMTGSVLDGLCIDDDRQAAVRNGAIVHPHRLVHDHRAGARIDDHAGCRLRGSDLKAFQPREKRHALARRIRRAHANHARIHRIGTASA
jgi:hypothetical protein